MRSPTTLGTIATVTIGTRAVLVFLGVLLVICGGFVEQHRDRYTNEARLIGGAAIAAGFVALIFGWHG